MARWFRRHWPAKGRLVRSASGFLERFVSGAVVDCVAQGFRFAEGPLWIEEDGCLLFSDIHDDRMRRLWDDGRVETFRHPSAHANGLTRDLTGRLIVCEQQTRRLTRTEADGAQTILADLYDGKRLNSPNDVVVRSDGAIYFTDPPCALTAMAQELSFQGVFRLSPDGGELRAVATDLVKPNGLAFSLDESLLFVDDSAQRNLWVFDVAPDGDLGSGRVFHDMDGPGPGSPDGMKLDVDGTIFCTGPGGTWVFTPGGRHLGTIVTPEKPTNCAFGGADLRTLYITTPGAVYRVRTKRPGVAPRRRPSTPPAGSA